MTDDPTFESFVELTRSVAGGEEFLPTFLDPNGRSLRVLEAVPEGEDLAEATRGWAASMGASRYYLAYPSSSGVTVEEYDNGLRVATAVV